jgi:hypothetical protein
MTGKVGIKKFDKHRGIIMGIATVCSIVSLILSIVPVVSNSSSNEDVRTTSWTYGKIDGGSEVFVGLKMIVLDKENGNTQSAEWTDSQCDDFETAADDDSSFCTDCKTACDNSVATTITNLISSVPTIVTDIQRSTRKGDLNCQKNMAIITGLISFFSTIAALSSYANGCYRHLPDTLFGRDVEYELGPGFVCLLTAALLKPIDIMINVLMPVAPHDDDLNEKLIFDIDETPDDIYDLNIG